MSWATKHIEDLNRGMSCVVKPTGCSMEPLIYSKDEVLVLPARENEIRLNDIVLCRVHGIDMLHKVITMKGTEYQIGNNRGYINGWTKTIYGVVLAVVKGKGKYVRSS